MFQNFLWKYYFEKSKCVCCRILYRGNLPNSVFIYYVEYVQILTDPVQILLAFSKGQVLGVTAGVTVFYFSGVYL